jgi:Ser/Thr protein kinase RdoA (MazF antagonist)
MIAAAKSHGMDGTLVAPDWPPLTLQEVRALLRGFSDYGEPIEILSVSPRPFSAASVVGTRAGRVFIKRHHVQVRDREGLEEEHRFIAHLCALGVPLPRVLNSNSGETAIASGDWMYELHEVPQGVDLYHDAHSWTPFRSLDHAHSAGQALAKLHSASRGFDAPARKPRPLVASFTIFADPDPEAAMHRYLAARPALAESSHVRLACEQALELLAPFHAELKPLLPTLAPLWTHNDQHASNLLWSDASSRAHAVAIIDFGLADRTNAVHDVAHAIERNIVEWLALDNLAGNSDAIPVHTDALHALLAGYEPARPFDASETAALAPMAALCHAEFALSEADYFLGVLHSDEKAAMAYDGWLVGHARWFRGTAGTNLLDELRCWADRRSRTETGPR